MFTGIVEEKGTIKSIQKQDCFAVLTIQAKEVLTDARIGDSIAVNGVCLTVTDKTNDSFMADVMAETLRRSSLGSLKAGSKVNLERAMAANGRFGGHIVSGHIDGTGTIVQMKPEGNATWVQIRTPDSILKYIVHCCKSNKRQFFCLPDPAYRSGDDIAYKKSRRDRESRK